MSRWVARMSVRVYTAEWDLRGSVIDLRSRPVGPTAVWSAVCAGAPQPRDAVSVAAPAPSLTQRLVGVVDGGGPQSPDGAEAVLPSGDALRAAVAAARSQAARQRTEIDARLGRGDTPSTHMRRVSRWAELAATAQALEEQLQCREARAWRRRQGLKRRLACADAVGNDVRGQRVGAAEPPGRWPESAWTELGLLRRAATPAPVVVADAVAPSASAVAALRRWLTVPAVIVV